jgi:putative ATPase
VSDLFGDAPGASVGGPAPAPGTSPVDVPLAERLRPHHLDEVIGQTHLLGPGKPLRVAFASGRPHSMILWGPPGVGKTTLARLMTDAFDAVHRFNKAVKSFINQKLRRVFVQIFGLPHCSVRAGHV